MPIEGERLAERHFLPRWVRHEHLARYSFAREYVCRQVVVDCACGDGTGSQIFAEGGARRVHAVDSCEHAVAEAAATRRAAGLTFCVADGTNLPLDSAVADVYVSLETVEHLADQEQFLREVTRVLKPTGRFICSTPDRRVYNPGQTLASRPWNRYHVREYAQPEFAELLGRHFAKIDWFGQNPKRLARVAFFAALGRVLPAYGSVRIQQILKVPRFLHDPPHHHSVVPLRSDRIFEYVVAVCTQPCGRGAMASETH